MRFALALFDQSTRDPSNDYWTWFVTGLQPVLSTAYGETICHNLPDRPQDLSATDLHGGIFPVGEWLCCYRVVNGGRDAFGRLGRFVVVCAFAKISEVGERNCADILNHPILLDISRAARQQCPVPPPKELLIDAEMPIASASPENQRRFQTAGSVTLSDAGALEAAGSLATVLLAQGVSFHCSLIRTPAHTRATIAGGDRSSAPAKGPAAAGAADSASDDKKGGARREFHRTQVLGAVGAALALFITGVVTGIIVSRSGAPPPATVYLRYAESLAPNGKGKSTYWFKLIPNGLKIKNWQLDGHPKKGRNTVLTASPHNVKVVYQLAGRNRDVRNDALTFSFVVPGAPPVKKSSGLAPAKAPK